MIDDAPGVSGAAPSASDPAPAETDGPPGSPAVTRAVLGSSAATDADIGWRRLAPGMLLVDPVREITELIKAQRGYELNSKVITAADQMLSATVQVR